MKRHRTFVHSLKPPTHRLSIDMFWIYFATINAVTVAAIALDEAAAQRDRRRVPETTLLTLALIGGSIGAARLKPPTAPAARPARW